jgi:hypothetical protein
MFTIEEDSYYNEEDGLVQIFNLYYDADFVAALSYDELYFLAKQIEKILADKEKS